jgi:calcineurin-like phosphoesterase
VENLAHGKGVTLSTLAEIDELGIDCFTSGNHIYDKKDQIEECFEKYPKLIRPANLPSGFAGHGYYRFATETAPSSVPSDGTPSPEGEKVIKNSAMQQYLVINIHGTVFCEKEFDGKLQNPFPFIDSILTQESQKGDIIIVDFHAEVTSEKIAMGYYLDGRTSFITGTHTHVPTADARVLPGGTAYITDTGMTGPLNGVIGVVKENALKKFLDPTAKFVNEIEEEGPLQINGALVEIGEDGKAVKIEKLYKEI